MIRTPKHIEEYIIELWVAQGVTSRAMVSRMVLRNKNFSITPKGVRDVLKRYNIDWHKKAYEN